MSRHLAFIGRFQDIMPDRTSRSVSAAGLRAAGLRWRVGGRVAKLLCLL